MTGAGKKITLSFDNGPHPINTPYVLEALKKFDAKASFFCIGDKLGLPENLALLGDIRAAGHLIGSHTMSHSQQLGEVTALADFERELVQAHSLLGEYGLPERWFRPFGNFGKLSSSLFNKQSIDYLCRENFSTVLWNCVPQDWIYEDSWDRLAMEMIADLSHPVVVLHDFLDKGVTRLPYFLEALYESGWEIEQDIPDSCIVTRAGQLNKGFDHLIGA
jgi:peptidoglycan/xylan/chitin deacetylase (PgdA/CDA1 family)